MKRCFYSEKIATDGEELIVKDKIGKLILEDFYIYNMEEDGDKILKIRINNSDEIVMVRNDEHFTFKYPIFSCVVIEQCAVKYGGIY
jgi:hypothetical protein